MKKAISLVLTVALVFGTLTGCAKKTEETSGLQLDMEQMLETAAQPSGGETAESGRAALREALGVPYRVEAPALSTQSETLSIAISADVEVPQTDTLPICRVSAADFTLEQVKRLYECFCGDAPMYDYLNLYKTKDAIQAQIDSLQLDLERNYAPQDADNDAWRAGYESEIASLSADLITAADDLGDAIQTVAFTQREADNGGERDVFAAVNAPAQPWTKEFFVSNPAEFTAGGSLSETSGGVASAPCGVANFSYRDYGRVSFAAFRQRDVTNEARIPELETTPAQAMDRVAALFDALGIGDMEPYRVCLARNSYEEGTGDYLYYVSARRTLGGVAVQSPFVTPVMGGIDDEYGWAYETLDVRLDDEGIIAMNWNSPLSVGETVVECANLLPFSSILAVAENMLPVVNEPDESDLASSGTYEIEIDRITLSLQRISDSTTTATGLFVPVWNFYGTQRYIRPDGIEVRQDSEEAIDLFERPFLSLNAVDGSVIDCEKGY
ncbi:MAG TPA: DUF6034 family protein [Eubacteriales bacterium]|nr:DUF6034 family protein [Eubacteriales bacterium]